MTSVTPDKRTVRIARNSLMLYVRLIVMTVVTLYTSRLVLQLLGETDFGIYSLIGGIVVFISFLNAALSTATQRFMSFELGKEGEAKYGLGNVFSASLATHAAIALLVLLIGETLGLWFVATRLNIPPERMNAALIAYQFILLTACAGFMRVPYNASIISHEKMSFYAVLSVAEALLRLLAVLLLYFTGIDKLVMFSVLNLGVSLIILALYADYNRRKFGLFGYRRIGDRSLFGRIISFSGWSLLGTGAGVGAQQGIAVILNIFRGVGINAGYGIALQLSAAVNAFVVGFQVAFNPQIVKSYAARECDYLRSLVVRTSRFSYYLLLVLSLPLLLNMEYVLTLWLGDVPQYAVSFCRLSLLYFFVDALAAPLWMSVQATGRIRAYQIIVSVIILANLPFSWWLLKAGYSPQGVLLCRLMLNFVAFVFRFFYVKKDIGITTGFYLGKVLLPVVSVTAFSIPLPWLVSTASDGFAGLAAVVAVSLICVILAVVLFGLTGPERSYLFRTLTKSLRRG